MPKRLKVKLRDKLNYNSFYDAYLRTCEHKKIKKEILLFELDLETNLMNLVYRIEKGTYHLSKYRHFVIYEPKRREILALPYKDRIVLQWYIGEFIKPYIVSRFIKDTYACLDGKGIHLASTNLQKYMRIMKRNYGSYYVIKGDIHHYFYSIDLNILYSILKKFIKDKELLSFTKQLIFENSMGSVGIPIGNYTSQYFANIYLNELDQYVKNELHVKYYLRYMDDFVLLVKDKEEAKRLFSLIEDFLREHLRLELNPKSRYFPSALGVDFCGYRIFETHKLLRKRCVVKIKKRIKEWNQTFEEEDFDIHEVLLCWNSFLGHSAHANSYHLQKKMFSKMLFLENAKEDFVPFKIL